MGIAGVGVVCCGLAVKSFPGGDVTYETRGRRRRASVERVGVARLDIDRDMCSVLSGELPCDSLGSIRLILRACGRPGVDMPSAEIGVTDVPALLDTDGAA